MKGWRLFLALSLALAVCGSGRGAIGRRHGLRHARRRVRRGASRRERPAHRARGQQVRGQRERRPVHVHRRPRGHVQGHRHPHRVRHRDPRRGGRAGRAPSRCRPRPSRSRCPARRSWSRRARPRPSLVNAPATMTVVSNETIEASPAQNYGDLLRSVPGLNVIQMSARDINLTSRQGTSTLSNSQLALLDGRSIYLDFFGLILWDFVPSNPSDIKQIEVVRGPASAVWGANALTGVVNIITKTPREAAGRKRDPGRGGLVGQEDGRLRGSPTARSRHLLRGPERPVVLPHRRRILPVRRVLAPDRHHPARDPSRWTARSAPAAASIPISRTRARSSPRSISAWIRS